MKRKRSVKSTGKSGKPGPVPELPPELWGETLRKLDPSGDAHWLLACTLVARQWRIAVLEWLRQWLAHAEALEWPVTLHRYGGVKPSQYNYGSPGNLVLLRTELHTASRIGDELGLLLMSLLAQARLVDLSVGADMAASCPAKTAREIGWSATLHGVFYRNAKAGSLMRPLVEHPELRIAHGMGNHEACQKAVKKKLKKIHPTHSAIIKAYMSKRMPALHRRALYYALMDGTVTLGPPKERSPLRNAVIGNTHLFDPLTPVPITLYVRQFTGYNRGPGQEPVLQMLWALCRWECDGLQTKLVKLMHRVLALVQCENLETVVSRDPSHGAVYYEGLEGEDHSQDDEDNDNDDHDDDDVFSGLVPGMKFGTLGL